MARLLRDGKSSDLLPSSFRKKLRSVIKGATDESAWDRRRQAMAANDARKLATDVGFVPVNVSEPDLRLGEKQQLKAIILRHYAQALVSADRACVNLAGALVQVITDVRSGRTDDALRHGLDALVYTGGAHRRLRKAVVALVGAQTADHWNQEPPAIWPVATDAGTDLVDLDAAVKVTKLQSKRKEAARPVVKPIGREQRSARMHAPAAPSRFRGREGYHQSGPQQQQQQRFFRQDRAGPRDDDRRR